jgi:hypothetical protein
MKTFRSFTACLLASLLITAFAAPASASCAVQLPLSQSLAASKVVFTGTVVSVVNERIATVIVDEVWKGGPLPDQVEVKGGPGDAQSMSSVDRSFERGDKYLFVPINDTPPFEDNACTATREYSPALEEARPLDTSSTGSGSPGVPAGEPQASPVNEGPNLAGISLIFAVSLAAAMAVGWALKRRAAKSGRTS